MSLSHRRVEIQSQGRGGRELLPPPLSSRASSGVPGMMPGPLRGSPAGVPGRTPDLDGGGGGFFVIESTPGGASAAQCVPLGRTTGSGRRVVWNGVPSSSVSAHVTRMGQRGSGVSVTWNSLHAACRYPTFMVILRPSVPLDSKNRADALLCQQS